MVVIKLILECLTIALIVIGTFRFKSAGDLSKQMREFHQRKNIELTQENLKQQKAYIKLHSNNIYWLGLNITVFALIILLIVSGYALHDVLVEKDSGDAIFLLEGVMSLIATAFVFLNQKIFSDGQLIRKNYIARHPENDLKLFVYPNELAIRYQKKNKKGTFLFFVAGVIAIVSYII